jgi:hypothetical protein
MYVVNDRTRSLWIGTNGGHVYVYSIVGFEPQSINGPAIATDHTSACSLGENLLLLIIRLDVLVFSKRNSIKT